MLGVTPSLLEVLETVAVAVAARVRPTAEQRRRVARLAKPSAETRRNRVLGSSMVKALTTAGSCSDTSRSPTSRSDQSVSTQHRASGLAG